MLRAATVGLAPDARRIRGVAQVLEAPGVRGVASEDTTVTFAVSMEESDTDVDGPSACGETSTKRPPTTAR